MDAQSYTAQERRAANQVWAAAGAYGFEPLFLAHNTDGTIDFYMNCIVGLVHKYYGDALIRDIFSAWEGDVRQPMLDDMAWLYLENAAYRLELPRRPVLEALRFAHADYFFAIQYKLSRQEWMAKNQLVYTMQAARWRKVLGHTAPVMTPYESSLAAALEPETVPEPAQLKNDLLALFAKFALFDGKVRQKPALHLQLQGFWAKLATKTMPTQMIKTDRVTVEHSGAVDATGSGLAVDKRRANITLKQRAAQDRAYIESCFGRCFYPPEQLRKAEQELCTGVHLGCHLWFSAGVPSPAQAPTPEARQLAQQAELQAERNRAYYAKNQELHRSVVLRLTEQIRNCILVHQQPDQRVARSGNLCAGRVWRAPYLNDSRVFLCPEEENCPAFTVDLLLDASASRLHCQEVIAAQGVILAESLANCGIPVRVSAFSSLRGYTVLRVLKGFADKNRQSIFRYFASGWNRDGLALRAAGDPADRCQPQRQPPHSAHSREPAGLRLRGRRRCYRYRRAGAHLAAAGGAGVCRFYGRGQQRRCRHADLRQKYGAHPRHGSACPRCRAIDPERDPGAWRLKKYKMTPVGATPALAGISRRGHFSQPIIIKHNHALNFCLLHAISFCKILSF